MEELHKERETEERTEIDPTAPFSGVGRAGLRVALESRDMRLLWAGLVVSQIGDSFLLVATLTIVRSLTSSPLAVAALAASIGLPTVLFGLFAGVMVDRFDRKKTMLLSDVVRGVVVLGLLLVRDARDLPIMLAVGFIMGTAGVLFVPARNALLPRLVRPSGLVAANMLVEGSQIAALVVGPALGGLFVTRFGAQVAIAADAFTFFLSGVAIFFMRIQHLRVHTEPLTAAQLRHDLMAGLKYIRGHRLLARLMATGAASMLGLGAVLVLGIVHLEEVYQVDASGFGALLSILGLGMVVGGGLVATPFAHHYPALFIGLSMGLLGASLTVFPFLPEFRFALVAIFVTGVGLIASRSVVAATMQMNVPDDRRGRVESANNVVIAATYNMSLVAAGALAAFIDTRLVFLIAGVLVLVAGALAFRAVAAGPSELDEEEAPGSE